MITEDQIDQIKGKPLVGAGGAALGLVESIYHDIDNGEPLFAAVTGTDGPVLVPLADADFEGHQLVVPYTREQVQQAPAFAERDDLTPEVERTFFEHYGLGVELHQD